MQTSNPSASLFCEKARLVSFKTQLSLLTLVPGRDGKQTRNLSRPQGVRGRNNDNARLPKMLGWEPSIPLERGLASTYDWIADQLRLKGAVSATVSAAAD